MKFAVQYLESVSDHGKTENWFTVDENATSRLEAAQLEAEYIRTYPHKLWRLAIIDIVPIPSSIYTPPVIIDILTSDPSPNG
jgi:hypothetical protein